MSEDYTDYIFKALAIGDGGCGKTALCIQFAQGFFQENYKLTIGVEFYVKTIKVKNYAVKLQIWDTGGQERFAYVRPMYYKGALGAILLFDITNRESFEHLAKWIEEVNTNVGQKIPLLLVGNKADLDTERKVSREEAEAFARDNDMYYMESSAKTAYGVQDVFGILALLMIGEPIPSEMLNQDVKAPHPQEEKKPADEELPTFEEYQDFAEETPKFTTDASSLTPATPTPAVETKPAFAPAPQPAVEAKPTFTPAPQPTVEEKPAFTPIAKPSLSPAPAFTPAAVKPSLSPTPAFTPAAKPSLSPTPSFTAVEQPDAAEEKEDLFAKKVEIHAKPIVISPEEPVSAGSVKPSFIENNSKLAKSIPIIQPAAQSSEDEYFAPPVPEKPKSKPSLRPIADPTLSSEPEASEPAESGMDAASFFGASEDTVEEDKYFAPPVPEKKSPSSVIVFDDATADPEALEKGLKEKVEEEPQKKQVSIEAFKPKTVGNTNLFNPLSADAGAKEKKADAGVNPFILPATQKGKQDAGTFIQPSKPVVSTSSTPLIIPTAKSLEAPAKPMDKKARKAFEKEQKEKLKRELEEKKKREKDLKKRKMKECTQCKAELPIKFKFCNKCGAKL